MRFCQNGSQPIRTSLSTASNANISSGFVHSNHTLIPYKSQTSLKTWAFSASTHSKEAASKAKCLLLIIRRFFIQLSVSTFTTFYSPLARSYLDYVFQSCSSNFTAYVDCLERIQWLVMRLIKRFRRLPYEERLRRLGLYSLNKDHLRGHLILLHTKWSLKDWISTPFPFLFRYCGQGWEVVELFRVLGGALAERRPSQFGFWTVSKILSLPSFPSSQSNTS